MTGANVVSRSALAAITVPSSIGSSDPLVALVVALCPPYQTKVVISKKKNDNSLSLTVGPDVLTSRNAILRCLCGSGLHGALDDAPFLLLGGHSSRSRGGASPTSSLAVAGISSWMSVASSMREGSGDDDGGGGGGGVSTLLDQLDAYLATRSFVVPAPSPTLADLDLYLSILSRVSGDDLDRTTAGGHLPHVRRWLVQCGATLDGLVVVALGNSSGSPALVPVIPAGLPGGPQGPMPSFNYGDGDIAVETEVADGTASSVTIAAAAPVDGGVVKGGGGAPTVGLTDDQKRASADKRAARKSADKAKAKAKDRAEPKNDGGGDGADPESGPNVSALDIRVGRIVKVWEHESSDKLYCEEVDVGECEPRKIASGLRSFYRLDEMQDRTVLVLCNLKARNLGGFPSHGMVLCASNADHTSVEFAVPPDGSIIGERVRFGEYDGEPEAENRIAKKKTFEALAPDLGTDGSGEVVWRGAKGTTSAGVCRAVNGMANARVS